MTGVRPGTPPEPVGRGFLHGRDDLAATALRPLLHRVGQPSCACGGLHAQSERGMGHPAGAPVVVDLGGALGTVAVSDSRSGSEIHRRFDDVFRGDGIEVVRTPPRTPQANGVAERFVGTVRTECLDRLLVLHQQHLERILEVFVDHYNRHRPHRALSLAPPEATRSAASSWPPVILVFCAVIDSAVSSTSTP